MRNVFLTCVSFIYFTAFGSIYLQAPGLYGDDGLTPVAAFLERRSKGNVWTDIQGTPSLVWLHAAVGLPPDEWLELLALLGTALSAMAAAGLATAPVMLALWALYLSCFSVGQTFLSFQWDILLLEVGAQAALLAPLLSSRREPPSRAVVWLLRFTLFKLMFMSGVVKISSQCPTWSELTALEYHFATQCIPTPLAWYAHQVPALLLKASVAATFVIEIPGALLLLLPVREIRSLGAALQVMLQLLIFLSGNYNYFNMLTAALCVPLLIDPSHEGAGGASGGASTARAAWRLLSRAATLLSALWLAWCTWRMVDVEWPAGSMLPRSLRLAGGMAELQPMIDAVLPPLCTRVMPALLAVATLHDVVEAALRPAEAVVAAPPAPSAPPAAGIPGSPMRLDEADLFLEPPPRSSLATAARRLLDVARLLLLGAAAAAVFGSSAVHLGQLSRPLARPGGAVWGRLAPWQASAHRMAEPWRLTAGYGLFRRMTGVGAPREGGASRVARPEIVLEASMDGQKWHEVEFAYKPGDVSRPPPFCAPHQPRLDWQMWFAALGDYGHNPWLIHLVVHLLQGTPQVRELVVPRGFLWPLPAPAGLLPQAPRVPRLIRAKLFHYDFAPANGSGSRLWWTREFEREYLPPLELSNPSLQDFLKGQNWHSSASHRCERYEMGGAALPGCAADGCGDYPTLPAAWAACTRQANGCDGVAMVLVKKGVSFQTRAERAGGGAGAGKARDSHATWHKRPGRCLTGDGTAAWFGRQALRVARPNDVELLGALAASVLLVHLFACGCAGRRARARRAREKQKRE